MTNSSTLQISSKPLKIVINDRLIKWNTARLIDSSIKNLRYLQEYELINKDIYDIYRHLVKYRNKYFEYSRDIYDLKEDLIKHLDNMRTFQDMVNSNDPSIDLKAASKEMFANDSVRCTIAVDDIEMERLDLLQEYSRPIKTLFNNLLSLRSDIHHSHSTQLNDDLVSEISEILRNKGLDEFEIPEELLTINQNQ